ncbi:MAG: ATP-binding protein [Acidimicrobiia bacterium]|nr:ATP-binding protein [Acidimicrobiia bacterium]
MTLTSFGAYRLRVPLSEPRFWAPVLAVSITFGILPFIPWESALTRVAGEVLMGLSAILVIAGLALLSTLAPISTLVFIDYFAVISFTAALGGRWIHFSATTILLVLNIVMPYAFGQELRPGQEIIVQSATLIVVAIVLSAVTSEFRWEAYQGHTRELELRRRETQLERLYEVSRTMADGQSLGDVLPTLVGKVGRFLEAQLGFVLLHQPRFGSLVVVSPIWTSGNELDIGNYDISLRDRNYLTSVFLNREPAFYNAQDETETGLLAELGITTAMAVPLLVDQRPLGVLVVADKVSGKFTADDREMFESLAAPAALILAQLERYEAAAETSKRMEELAQMKTDFVSVVSHELRTPLTSIIGSLATLARPELVPPVPAARDLLQSARTQSDRLRRLIEDLLMVSRIDNNALPQHPVPVNLRTFVTETAAIIPGAEGLVRSSVHKDVGLEVDPDHLARILRNLIENALKYAPDQVIDISAQQTGSTVRIQVIDHGEGIHEDLREVAFERFAQLAPASTRLQGGTGLGLWIVRSLTEAMGGLIDLTDTPGGGATFTVTLPLRAGFMTNRSDPEFAPLGNMPGRPAARE